MIETKTLKAMVAGHICLDITPVFDPDNKGSFGEIFSPGKLINVGQAVLSTGGAVANTGRAMAKMGVNVLLNGKVGDDAIGGLIKQLVGRDHASSLKTVSGQASSYTIVLALPDIDRVFLHSPGPNDTFTAVDIDYDSLKACSLFHFGYPTLMKKFYENQGDELVRMFRRVKASGVITSLDMTLPDPNSESGKLDWPKIFEKVLPYVDIFLPSIEEIAFMLDRDLFERRKVEAGNEDPVFSYTAADCSHLSEKLIEMGTAIVAVKNGIQGYYLRTADQKRLDSIGNVLECDSAVWSQRELWAGSYKADKFGSAAGAGDATIAGFLTAFLRGLNPIECLKVANTVGWQNVREVDTISGIEDWPRTLEMVSDKSRKRNPLDINESGWQYNTDDQVFYGPSDSALK
jgi:sugar/nucleoside kinase (ribokinase family)